MDSRKAKAEKWKKSTLRGIEIIKGSLERGATLADRGYELYLRYSSLGWCELVLSDNPEPARQAFSTALRYWFYRPSERQIAQAHPLLEVTILGS